MSTQSPLPANPDFSLVLGGPLYQLFRRAHLAGDGLEMLRRRVIVLAGIAWIPLFLLSLASGRAFGDAVRIPFLNDIEAHVRFLVALPLLIAAELIVHSRLMPAVRQFVERRIVSDADMPKFRQAIESTVRLRNSVWIETRPDRTRLYGGHLDLAHRGRDRLGELVRGSGRRRHAPHAGRLVVPLRQRADFPVHPAALVLPVPALVPVPVPGLAPRPEADPDARGPDRRPRVPRHEHDGIRAGAGGAGRDARGPHRQPDLPRRACLARVQGADRRRSSGSSSSSRSFPSRYSRPILRKRSAADSRNSVVWRAATAAVSRRSGSAPTPRRTASCSAAATSSRSPTSPTASASCRRCASCRSAGAT